MGTNGAVLGRASLKWVVEYLSQAGGFLFGRRTFESLAGYWPNAREELRLVDSEGTSTGAILATYAFVTSG